MKLKSKVLYPVICAVLFVMTFTAVTSFAATNDVVNSTYIGTYYNTSNSESFFTISSTNPTYPITAIGVYDSQRGINFNGSGDSVAIDSTSFSANFPKVRKANENGDIIGTSWINGVTIAGDVDVKIVWFKKVISVTLIDKGPTYEKN